MSRLADVRAYLELPVELVIAETGIDDLDVLEAGRRDATELEFARLARVYDCSTTYLRREDAGDMDAAVDVVARMGPLSPDDREEALRFAVYLDRTSAHDG